MEASAHEGTFAAPPGAVAGTQLIAVAFALALVLVAVLTVVARRFVSLRGGSLSKCSPAEATPADEAPQVIVAGQRSRRPSGDEEAKCHSSSSAIDIAAVAVERPIGSGGQGGVWLAYDPVTGTRCALKQVHKGRLAALKKPASIKPQQCQWLVEREALQKCGGHPFITTCYATFQDNHSLYFALELAAGGDLFNLLHTSTTGQLPEAQARFYTSCVALALRHIHTQGFLYCDIKLENVLLCADGYVKLCDFGLAKKLVPPSRKRYSFLSAKPEARSFSKCGTDQYAPPEVVAGAGRSMPADWWALGVLLHEMLTGHSPFEGTSVRQIYARVDEYSRGGRLTAQQLKEDVMQEASTLSTDGADFLLGLLAAREKHRLGCGRGGFALGVQGHPWFANDSFDWLALLRRELSAPWVPSCASAPEATGDAPAGTAEASGLLSPTREEIDEDVAALFNSKTGVLRDRPFEPSAWAHLFAPFGPTVARVIKDGIAKAGTRQQVEDNSDSAGDTSTANDDQTHRAAAPTADNSVVSVGEDEAEKKAAGAHVV